MTDTIKDETMPDVAQEQVPIETVADDTSSEEIQEPIDSGEDNVSTDEHVETQLQPATLDEESVDSEMVQDGEELDVESEDATAPEYATEEASKAMQILNLDTLIKRYLGDIQDTKERLKEQKQMLEDTCEGDAEYHAQSEKVKEETKKKQAIKQRIMKQASVSLIADKIMELKDEVKEAEEALYAYAIQYRDLSGMNQIVHDDGSILEIVSTTKLVKKGKFRP